jgi:hypothetical protein
MKPTLLTLAVLSALLGLATGCGKKEEAPPPPASSQGSSLIDSAKQAGQQAADAAREVGAQVIEQGRQAGQAVGEAVKQVSQEINTAASTALADTSAAVTTRYNEAVSKARALLQDAKYEEALNALKSLGSLQLTSEQQKIVSDLKTQIETAWQASKKAGSTATEAVKGLLK